jgi:hypothetical protein
MGLLVSIRSSLALGGSRSRGTIERKKPAAIQSE